VKKKKRKKLKKKKNTHKLKKYFHLINLNLNFIILIGNKMTEDTISRYAVKPLTIGAVGYAASRTIFPQLLDANWGRKFTFSDTSPLKTLYGGSTSVSVPVMAGIALATGSVLAEVAHEFIFPHVHWLDKSSEKASMLTSGVVAGAGMAAVVAMGNSSGVTELGLPSILAVGVASEIVGDMLYKKFTRSSYESLVVDN
jgi:hypothetical protein